MLNKVLVSLGSNFNREENIQSAARQLSSLFPIIYFSPAVYTEPVGSPQSSIFMNQVAIVYSPYSIEELKSIFKRIEKRLGRRPEDKMLGLVPIDIDLLKWNDQILKPEDMERSYIISGIHSIFTTRQYNEWCQNKSESSGATDQTVNTTTDKR
ncbi:2-amino-4-hydroxy-6-hydroxymethyldihydropteridine diphosphokinase [Parabacteroides bouchesdurhonensis]|uniref:2-amino-4-hydroxy-6- hydroxymethyldihydropteridine diphosphokinase n=1 Tax=Parabacteroides bouchesdurhonensis TaxID=1936995 RepID=UPI000C866411|nr:2-amino-4-hydroxy-6-hydroxymethyldihydropteridine diphosphokinase [Parabacteroides bouchesdurhonensis]